MNEEPSIDEQVGGVAAPDSRQRRHERASLLNTKFREINGYEFWITPYNRIFLVESSGGNLTHPHLTGLSKRDRTGHGVILDPPWGNVPDDVLAELFVLLVKQDSFRSKMIQEEEYEDDDRWKGWL